MNCDPIGFRKWIGNHFKLLAIEPNAPSSGKAKVLHVCADSRNWGKGDTGAGHDRLLDAKV
jgi:hypothetical protein